MKLVHGGDLASYHHQFPGKPVLDFSANINPLGLAQGVRQAYLDSLEECTHYPDPLCRSLRAALSSFEGVPEDWILCGNGASDLICRIAWALRPKNALLLAPTFADYERALTATGCTVNYHLLVEENDFLVDDSILEAIEDVELVFLCNPNNPTGSIIQDSLMKRIITKCRQAGVMLVLDECFMDFLDDGEKHSCKPELGQWGGLLILRAFTKIFAIPGLRLGYLLCSDAGLLARIDSAGPTWAVSVPAQRCGVAAIGETAYLNELRRNLTIWREELTQGLQELGCMTYPSFTNYIFFRAQVGLAVDVRPHGVMLRDCSNYIGLCDGFYRTAVRTREENQVLLGAVAAALGKKVAARSGAN